MSTSNDIPLFHHEPLQEPRNHIRLLYVVLVDKTLAIEGIEVQCRLITQRFKPGKKSRFFFDTERREVTPLYHAISYTWGSPDDTVPILVNGRRMEVTRNCEYALKQSAWYGGARYVWCDAICIDQTNDDEKGHQVYMMGDIYHNAEAVLACVGPHAHGSPALLRALRTNASILDRIAASAPDDRCLELWSLRPFLTPWPARKRERSKLALVRQWKLKEEDNMAELILAMKGFLDRHYFSRTWIYQEIVLGRHIILCCGHTTARLYSLYGMFLAMEHLQHLSGTDTTRVWPLIRAGAFSWSSNETDSLETLMGHVLPLECGDPRDKVYAVLSLVRDCPIYPDYTIDALSLASKVLADKYWQTPYNQLDYAWKQLPVLSSNLRLSNPAHGLGRAIYERQFCPQLMYSSDWPYIGSRDDQSRVRYPTLFMGVQLDKSIDGWSFRDIPLKHQSVDILQCQFNDRDSLEDDMIMSGILEADTAILLPEVASSGDWCLLPYCETTYCLGSLILIARREAGDDCYKIIGKGLGRGDVLRHFGTRQHDFWIRFGCKDLLVLFNQGVFSLSDFLDRPSSGVNGLRFEEMKGYMRTGVCGRPRSSLARTGR